MKKLLILLAVTAGYIVVPRRTHYQQTRRSGGER